MSKTSLPIILASASPRRRELLEAAGFQITVVPSTVEEMDHAAGGAVALAEENARIKAEDVARAHPDATVLGADTVVVVDGDALGKPRDLAEASGMLARLSGRDHDVVTGVCIAHAGREPEVFHVATRVRFAPLAKERIAHYYSLVNPLDKAGAYAIQEHAELLGAEIDGSYSNVMGLPMEELAKRLG